MARNTSKAKAQGKRTLGRTLKACGPDYRAYVKAQIARAQAATPTAATKAQRTMNKLRPSYTQYRRAYAQLRKAQAA